MAKDKKKGHLRLVKTDNLLKGADRIEQELLDELERIEEVEFLLLSGPPDWTVAIDKRAPMETRLRVMAAVKSCSMGNKSMDYLLRKYREAWEKKLCAED
jgi:hypothetical protein